MLSAAGGGGKSTWAGIQFNPKLPPLQKKGKIRCWRWTEISLVWVDRLKAGRHRQPARHEPLRLKEREMIRDYSLPPRTDRTEKAHSRKWQRRKQMEEQRRWRAAFWGVLFCGAQRAQANASPRSLERKLHSGVRLRNITPVGPPCLKEETQQTF